jgi:hypothetical protein
LKGLAPPTSVIGVYNQRKTFEADIISSHGDATRFFVTFLDNHDMKERIRYEMPENPTEFDDQVTLGLGRSSHLRLAAMCQGSGLVAA